MNLRCLLFAAPFAGICPPTFAVFTVNGTMAIEQFNGTAKETTTWQERIAGGSIVKNDNLTMSSSQFDDPEYTTNVIAIPVGGFARVKAHINTSAIQTSATLILTTNSQGTSQLYFF